MVVATNECTSVAGHFNGHAEVLKGYIWHRLMQHVQGCSRSHWMLQLGNYSLRFALAATRATANKSSMTNVPTLMAVSAPVDMLAPNINRGGVVHAWVGQKHLHCYLFKSFFLSVIAS